VLVVGGGDSALEAAIQLADETDARVGISYRKPEFGRCRPLNKQKLDAHVKSGRIETFMSTEVLSVERDAVSLKNGTTSRIPNDFVIACLGGEMPNGMLKTLGISIRKHHGDKAMANPALARRAASRRSGRAAATLMFVVGALVVAGLAWVGRDYYLLPRALRYKAAQHAALKPSGPWGHGVGVLATMFMLLNFVYPLRKRLPMFKGRGSIAPWLRFHVFVGIMSPLVIIFHTAFQWGNQLATSTYLSVLVVVTTGLIGRWVFGWVRVDPGETIEVKRLAAHLSKVVSQVPPEWQQHARASDPAMLHVLSLAANGPKLPSSLPGLFLHMPFAAMTVRRGLRHCRRLFLERSAHRSFCADVHEFRRLRAKFQFHRHFKRLMSAWRSLHVVLAVVLLALIATHVWVSLRVGFRWIWS